jgi:hypothetical protein
MKNVKIAAMIAVVVITALALAKTVGFKFDKDGVSLSANNKDTVSVKTIDKSAVEVQNRDGQDVNIEGVSNDSKVNVK